MKPSRSYEAPTSLRPRRRFGGRWLIVPLACLVLLAAAEAALWLVAVSRADAAMDSYLQREAERGRVWTCPQRRFYGYPLQVGVECMAPTFAGTAGGRHVTASLKALRAEAAVYRPTQPVARLEGPLDVKLDDGRELTVDWASCAITLEGMPFAIERASIEIEQPVAALTSDTDEPVKLTAARASLHALKLAPQSPDAPDLEIAASVEEAVVPPLDRLAGTSAPITGEALAAVTHGDRLEHGSLADRLEAWRTGGGRAEIGHASMTKGTSHVEAEATLALDEGHRPTGELHASVSGVEAVMRRLGLPNQAASLGSLLTGLLGTQAQAEASAPAPNSVSLALTLANGRVYLGPFRLPMALRPLY